MFTSGFFNSINSDRRYNAEQMASIFDGLITDGIFDSIGDHFQVTPASSGLGVNIGTGRAWLNQTWSYNDTTYPVTLGAASPSLGRKDLICIKVDKSSAVRSNSLVVIAGTPAASPVEPTVTDDTTNGIYYHKLAAVTVQAGATSISGADITNYIGLSTGTPYVTGLLSSTTVDELWSQWDGEFNDWWDDIKATLDDNIVTTILNKIDHITPKEATMNLYGFSHINPPPSGKTYQEYSTDAILNQISSLLNGFGTATSYVLADGTASVVRGYTETTVPAGTGIITWSGTGAQMGDFVLVAWDNCTVNPDTGRFKMSGMRKFSATSAISAGNIGGKYFATRYANTGNTIELVYNETYGSAPSDPFDNIYGDVIYIPEGVSLRVTSSGGSYPSYTWTSASDVYALSVAKTTSIQSRTNIRYSSDTSGAYEVLGQASGVLVGAVEKSVTKKNQLYNSDLDAVEEFVLPCIPTFILFPLWTDDSGTGTSFSSSSPANWHTTVVFIKEIETNLTSVGGSIMFKRYTDNPKKIGVAIGNTITSGSNSGKFSNKLYNWSKIKLAFITFTHLPDF